MRSFLLFTFILSLLGCSTFGVPNAPKRNLDIASVESLKIGKVTGEEVSKLLGKPDQVVPLKRDLTGKDAWLYTEAVGDQKFDRLGLVVDQKTGIVQTATWSVYQGEPLFDKRAALSHFKNAKFTAQQMAKVAPDYYSDDVTYNDRELGITLFVNGLKQTVSSISFDSVENTQ